jgi:tRNA (adenine37-N6)-methyltransferase
MKEIHYKPIGRIHSPFQDIQGMPIQPSGARGVAGTVELFPEYSEGLKDIEGFSHVILLYHFHLSTDYALQVKPFLDDSIHGVFATRAPKRPNAIGLSVVRLVNVTSNIVHIEDVDVIDGTPLVDIKPYVPEFDVRQAERIGWLSNRADKVSKARADGRFR